MPANVDVRRIVTSITDLRASCLALDLGTAVYLLDMLSIDLTEKLGPKLGSQPAPKRLRKGPRPG